MLFGGGFEMKLKLGGEISASWANGAAIQEFLFFLVLTVSLFRWPVGREVIKAVKTMRFKRVTCESRRRMCQMQYQPGQDRNIMLSEGATAKAFRGI